MKIKAIIKLQLNCTAFEACSMADENVSLDVELKSSVIVLYNLFV